MKDSKLTEDGLFSEKLTILNDGKAIIKAKDEIEARETYKKASSFLS